MFTGVGEIPHPPCQSHCELQSLKTMKSIRLDVSSDIPAFRFSSFSFPFPPPPSTSALHRILSASCWATSLWEADTMADVMLSTPNEPCFPRDPPGPVGIKPHAAHQASWALHGWSTLVSEPLTGVPFLACSQLKCSCQEWHLFILAPPTTPLYILFSDSLQHFNYSLHLQLSVSMYLLIHFPSVYPKLPVLVSMWSLLPGI